MESNKEDLSEIFTEIEVKPNSNNIRRQFIINELGGLKFKNGSGKSIVEIYESSKNKKGEWIHETKSIVLDQTPEKANIIEE